MVALYARAWVEIVSLEMDDDKCYVALYARAWVEILSLRSASCSGTRRPLREGVGRNC